jgi:hypothetical protein
MHKESAADVKVAGGLFWCDVSVAFSVAAMPNAEFLVYKLLK